MGFPEKRKIPNRMEGRVGVRLNIDSTACSPRGGVWYKGKGKGCKVAHIHPMELLASELS